MLKGKHILLGVTGGIAAYKSAFLVREFVRKGAEVRVVMTEMAKQFITPLTLATLSKNPILVDFFDPTSGAWNSHVALGEWADAFVIAPATANTIGKMASGVADNLLLTSYLSAKCPVFVAPAMDLDMFAHSAVQENFARLKNAGCQIIDAETGFLASGLEGKGRMAEPQTIVEKIEKFFSAEPKPLSGKKILITAGPTFERIDPVRFIGNHSSGKMGFALAQTCADLGAAVVLVAGPVALKTENSAIKRVDVFSADEMYSAVNQKFSACDGAILCAAVADFKPKNSAAQKIKREKETLSLELVPTQDIAAALGEKKRDDQFLVGFALETQNEQQNALGKLQRKNLDFIVLNSLNDDGAGFGFDTNKIKILFRNGEILEFPLKSKTEVAKDIINEIVKML